MDNMPIQKPQNAPSPAKAPGPVEKKAEARPAAPVAGKAITPSPGLSAAPPVAKVSAPATSAMKAPASSAGTAKSAAPKRQARFELYQCNARAVFLAGSFNAWDPQATPMKNNGAGKWEAALQLEPGRYEYRFIVDGKWIDDPLAKESVPNPYEGANAVLVLT